MALNVSLFVARKKVWNVEYSRKNSSVKSSRTHLDYFSELSFKKLFYLLFLLLSNH